MILKASSATISPFGTLQAENEPVTPFGDPTTENYDINQFWLDDACELCDTWLANYEN